MKNRQWALLRLAGLFNGRTRFAARPLALLVCASVGALMAASARAQSFSYASFADTAGLQINGSAAAINVAGRDLMRLTPPQGNTGGSIFSTQAITLADHYSFSTRFTFNIGSNNVNQYGEIGADGIAFLIQPLSNTVGGFGGAMGYGGISPSLAVEFDTYSNGGSDPRLPGNDSLTGNDHVAIMLNGDYNNHLAYSIVSPTLELNGGQDITAFVDYDSVTSLLQVRWSTDGLRPDQAGLSYAIDLASVFGTDPVYVGFTASTGADWSEQDIVNWAFNDVYDPITTAPSDIPSNDVPEPASWTIVLAGIAGAGWAMRRSRPQASRGRTDGERLHGPSSLVSGVASDQRRVHQRARVGSALAASVPG